ncbi:c-type cytochrome [Lignipirellula cremea]|uniref:Cytochrome c n=1 Tax=Lignipirellula cremea TaxID=2528010 RepID=A0A518DNL2_9BACT|nr:c-type cytochrome [Lignipirellula cremea]QDU93427.1 Cytochrome c [Lignipirellula cremea]
MTVLGFVRSSLVRYGCLAFALLAAGGAVEAAHPLVPGFERFYWSDDSDAQAGGRLLLTELNCTSCHAPAKGDLSPKPAPLLHQVSGRVRPEWLQAFLADPQGVKPGATMPNLFAGLPAEEKQHRIDALTQYLFSLGPGKPEQTLAAIGSRERGEHTFHTVGCVACHNPRTAGAPQLPTSVPLGDLEAKYTLPSLASFLREPHRVRPGGRMPSLNLSSSDASDIAAYLLPRIPEQAGLAYAYYEGSWTNLPDFDGLTPVAAGAAEKIDVSLKKRGDRFALRFEGSLTVDAPGNYRFWTKSDDGSRLLVDGKIIVNNDGVHAPAEKTGEVKLEPGRHLVVVEYFENAGGEELAADFQPPGGKRQPLHAALSAPQPTAEELPPITFTAQPELVAEGRRLFQTTGCASCHQQQETPDAAALVSQLTAPALVDLDAAKGCLATTAVKGVPSWSLSDRQRTALATAVQEATPAAAELLPQQKIAVAMTRFNCYACHARDKIGGIEQERLEYFTTTQPEMGTEGSIPPGLDLVGGKLTRKWLDSILAHGAKDRPYMLTQMPNFGAANVGQLAPVLEKLDVMEPLPELAVAPDEARKAGRSMVGEKGFGCIKCHTFGPFKATGVQSIDMTVMHERLREDWFRRYLAEPQQFRRGTRMPSAWPPPPNPSLLADILGGDSELQILSVWKYLADGKRARTPLGLYNNTNELLPLGEAVIYRNFIEGVSPRGIAVGYPEETHIAWDADQLALRLMWKGAFIDANRHWSGRGQGFQPPLGQEVIKLPPGPALAILATPETAWPLGELKPQGYQFQGYSLSDDQRPTFLYKVNGIEVAEFPNPEQTPAGSQLVRTLTCTAEHPPQHVYFRAATGQIEALDDGSYRIGEGLTTRITAPGKPILRESKGSQELLLPVEFQNGKAVIVQTFSW